MTATAWGGGGWIKLLLGERTSPEQRGNDSLAASTNPAQKNQQEQKLGANEPRLIVVPEAPYPHLRCPICSLLCLYTYSAFFLAMIPCACLTGSMGCIVTAIRETLCIMNPAVMVRSTGNSPAAALLLPEAAASDPTSGAPTRGETSQADKGNSESSRTIHRGQSKPHCSPSSWPFQGVMLIWPIEISSC